MHTTKELDSTSFEYRVDGDVVPRETVMPHVTSDDRVGVVMGTGVEGLGAGNFVLSCVTAFYDYLRETREEDFFEYPDYYTFQTTGNPADYRMLDIYPDHKNVSVNRTAEHLLRAINDRAITTLLVPNETTNSFDLDDITLQSAHRRIDHCYVYAPDGCPSNADFSIRQPRQPANEWFETTVESLNGDSEVSVPSFGCDDNWIVQQFRQVSVKQALERLPI
ncbi:hypothetical protein Htur_3996 (plasmid) [Haloterrigena turkmenica DSM 5511]|uniref:Uncharacterized protein n=1 Tax=Haloterrigena turkmenica (strain ATCC 51198 / DSM 5511 / JCM 9101 / NCIMB 13204 / VKM B-1734 / 4k) TaxID=543526 RepID=D2S0E7_HALTV|nr:hypothetical protein [Haloterrigena turkmenica]ADB62844.1 hypothetical protein Htur_3996 [Haloterrigena turkmenica DSM 5511]